MGASQGRSGYVPENNAEINEGIVRGIAEKVAGQGTSIGKTLQVAPGGKQLEKRFAGDLNLPSFFGSKDAESGTSGQSYISEGAKPVTKSLRGKYLGSGINTIEGVGVTEE